MAEIQFKNVCVCVNRGGSCGGGCDGNLVVVVV